MSKIFYDHLISLSKIEKEINKVVESKEEKLELWQIIDEIIHHRVLGCIFQHLPQEHHYDFLEKFHRTPHDESLMHFLKEKIGEVIEELIKKEVDEFSNEILQDIKGRNHSIRSEL